MGFKNAVKKYIPAFCYGAAACALFGFADSAMAKDFATIAAQSGKQFQGMADLLSTGSYLVGSGMAVQAALKFREHNENPQNVKLSKPITYALVSGMLLGLPTWMSVGKDSLFTDSQDSTYNANGIDFGKTVGK